jgi:glutaredoxin
MLPDTGERYLSTPLFADVAVEMTEEELELSRSTPGYRFDVAPATVPAATQAAVALDEAAIREVESLLGDPGQPVIMFALEWCEFCWSVRKLFSKYGIAYTSVDLDSVAYQHGDRGGKIREVLKQRTGSPSLPQIFVASVTTMKVGDLSPVLRSANGFHILKLLDKRGNETPVIVQQTHTRHILVRLNEVVSEADAKQRLFNLKERIDNGTDFAELARLQSEDASSSRGGDLGWLSPGDTVPEFERAMNALEPGQVSEPVQSPFGWHLIQVLERRNEDMSKERQRLLARQAIRARKSDEAYQEWVRQQRDRAYVELRLEER